MTNEWKSEPIGLLAGGGRFPVLFAEKMQHASRPVVCVGVRGEASESLVGLVDRFHWTGIAKLGRMIRCFKREGVREIVMAGKIQKKKYFYGPLGLFTYIPDWRALRFMFRRWHSDNRDDSIMLDMIAEFETEGMRFTSALDYCPELLVRDGVLTRRGPSAAEEADIHFGWQLAKEMGRLDVGQSVAVKKLVPVAVEAIEGTDQAIARAGELCRRGGFVVVKVAKPQQDMRFDVPTVGVATIESMHKAGGRVLAIESNKTIIIDEADTIALADKLGITIVARAA